jgi:tetratricopeptide (TPR) repeat protein
LCLQATDADVHFERGHAFLNKLAYDKAITEFTEAIRLEPNAAVGSYASLGMAYFYQGDFDKANADFSRIP